MTSTRILVVLAARARERDLRRGASTRSSPRDAPASRSARRRAAVPARTALRLMDEPVRFISTVQVGITRLRDRARRDRRAARLALLRLPAARCRVRDLVRRPDVPQRRRRRARAEGGRAAEGGDARARARRADRRPLSRLLADRLGAAALGERRPARARREARARRDDRLHPRRHPALRRRGRGRRRDPDRPRRRCSTRSSTSPRRRRRT